MANRKRTKGQTTIYKAQKIKIEQHEPHTNNRTGTQVLRKGMHLLLHKIRIDKGTLRVKRQRISLGGNCTLKYSSITMHDNHKVLEQYE